MSKVINNKPEPYHQGQHRPKAVRPWWIFWSVMVLLWLVAAQQVAVRFFE